MCVAYDIPEFERLKVAATNAKRPLSEYVPRLSHHMFHCHLRVVICDCFIQAL